MSNQQWNNGSNDWAPQPQGSSNEWGAQRGAPDWNDQQGWQNQGSAPAAQEWPQQGEAAGQDWNQQAQPQGSAQEVAAQQSAQEWPQQQPSASGQDWQAQQGAQDWNQQQAPAAGDWNQQQAQAAGDWNQQQPVQDWNQQGAQNWNQGGAAPYQPQGQYAPAPAKGNPFDFSFKSLSLPGSAGLIFMLGVIAIGVEWLFSFIYLLASGNEYVNPSAMAILNNLIGGLAGALFKILILRVLIEIGVALTKKDNPTV